MQEYRDALWEILEKYSESGLLPDLDNPEFYGQLRGLEIDLYDWHVKYSSGA